MGIQPLVTIGVIIVMVAVFGWATKIFMSRYFVKASVDRAFVRTAGGKATVVFNRGDWVFPTLHSTKWVDLRTMDIDVVRTGAYALRTSDAQYIDFHVVFFIRINPIQADIERAARTIGGAEVNAESVRRLVENKLDGALRDVAATFTSNLLHENREKFIERVQSLVRMDLAENGLILESITLTILDRPDGYSS